MLWDPAAETKITGFLATLRAAGLRLEYILHHAPASPASPAGTVSPADNASPAGNVTPAEPLHHLAASAAPAPRLLVDFTGPDAALLIEHGGEVLHAIESLAAAILRLEPEENDQLSFDALGFKQARDAATARTAQQGIDAVHATGQPFVFPPMNSRERRMLHLVLATSGLPTASSGDGARRFVVVYPPGATPTPERFDPPPPPRRPGSHNGRGQGSSNSRGQTSGNSRAGQGSERRPTGRPTARFTPGPPQPSPPAAPRHEPKLEPRLEPRLDPNGNPLEQPPLPETAAATSEEERLASLRRAFRKR